MKYKHSFFMFFLAMTLFHLASNFAHPVTPTIFKNLNLPDYMFGLALAAMMIANFALSPFWGKVNLFFSSRTSLLICCLGYGVAQLGFAYATTQVQVLLVRVLAGVFIGGVFVSLLTYVVNAAKPEDQGRYLTYSATIHSVFGAFGYLVGGLLGEYSIRATFLLQAGTLVLSGVLFRLFCVADCQKVPGGSRKEMLQEINPLKAFHDGRYFMNTAFLLLFIVNALINLGNTGFDQVFNYYLKDQLGLTSSYNGIIKAAVGFISFAANMTLCTWIIHKTRSSISLAVVIGVCALSSFGTFFSSHVSVFIICGILLYAGYSVSLPVLQNMVACQADPTLKNLVMGFYNATKSLGSIIGSLAVGFLYTISAKIPFITIFVVYSLSILVMVVYCLYLTKHTQPHGS